MITTVILFRFILLNKKKMGFCENIHSIDCTIDLLGLLFGLVIFLLLYLMIKNSHKKTNKMNDEVKKIMSWYVTNCKCNGAYDDIEKLIIHVLKTHNKP